MKQLVILGGGTAGTIMANQMAKRLEKSEWQIKLVEKRWEHYYQPGFLLVPFGLHRFEDIVRPARDFYPSGIEIIPETVQQIIPEKNKVILEGKRTLSYNYLIIATGLEIHPEKIEGTGNPGDLFSQKGHGRFRDVFDFYTPEGCFKLSSVLKNWQGGRLVIHTAKGPMKSPHASLEFAFLSDWWFREKKMRDQVDITYVTPYDHILQQESAPFRQSLSAILADKNIKLTTNFSTQNINIEKQIINGEGGAGINYDLLISTPVNMGASVIARSEMGDELNFIPTDPETLRSLQHENIFVIGDAAKLMEHFPKLGSAIYFQSKILVKNLLQAMRAKPLKYKYDGHGNCLISTGFKKAIMVDFSYNTASYAGSYPVPWIGPLSLLKETRLNYCGKLMVRSMYWKYILKGKSIILPHHFSKWGKDIPKETSQDIMIKDTTKNEVKGVAKDVLKEGSVESVE